MKKIEVSGYNLNTDNGEIKIFDDIKYNNYTDLIEKMKNIHKEKNLEYLKTKKVFPIYRLENNLQCVEISINREGEVEFNLEGGEVLTEEDIEKKADEVKEDEDEFLMDMYIQTLKQGSNRHTTYCQFVDGLSAEEVLALEDISYKLPNDFLTDDEVWNSTNCGQDASTLDFEEEGVECLDKELLKIIKDKKC